MMFTDQISKLGRKIRSFVARITKQVVLVFDNKNRHPGGYHASLLLHQK